MLQVLNGSFNNLAQQLPYGDSLAYTMGYNSQAQPMRRDFLSLSLSLLIFLSFLSLSLSLHTFCLSTLP